MRPSQKWARRLAAKLAYHMKDHAHVSCSHVIGSMCACRAEEIKESDIGTRAGLFEVQKIGDEFFTFIVDCKDPKACTILLRGGIKGCPE